MDNSDKADSNPNQNGPNDDTAESNSDTTNASEETLNPDSFQAKV
jgi:hypothetical protein